MIVNAPRSPASLLLRSATADPLSAHGPDRCEPGRGRSIVVSEPPYQPRQATLSAPLDTMVAVTVRLSRLPDPRRLITVRGSFLLRVASPDAIPPPWDCDIRGGSAAFPPRAGPAPLGVRPFSRLARTSVTRCAPARR